VLDPAPESLLYAWASLLGEAPACQRLAERNYVYRVRAPGQNFILKEAGLVNPQGDVPRMLAADLAVLRHLQAQGVGVAVPEPTGHTCPPSAVIAMARSSQKRSPEPIPWSGCREKLTPFPHPMALTKWGRPGTRRSRDCVPGTRRAWNGMGRSRRRQGS
jgi:hypothetical protein